MTTLPNNQAGRKLRVGKKDPKVHLPQVPVDAHAVFVPLATNFDFLEGAYMVARATRRTLLAVAAFTLVAMCSLALFGFAASSQATTSQAAADAADQQAAAALAEIGKLDQAGGINATKLRAHAQERQAIYAGAVTGELDSAELISRLRASTPAGVTLTNVDITNGASTDPAQAPSATPAAPAGARGLVLTATATSYSAISAWSRALNDVPGLALNGEPGWSGASDALQVTLSGSLNDAANTTRAKSLTSQDEFGLPKTETK